MALHRAAAVLVSTVRSRAPPCVVTTCGERSPMWATRWFSSSGGGLPDGAEWREGGLGAHEPDVTDAIVLPECGPFVPEEEEEDDEDDYDEVLIADTGEWGGPRGLEPTRYGDWERKGRASDFS